MNMFCEGMLTSRALARTLPRPGCLPPPPGTGAADAPVRLLGCDVWDFRALIGAIAGLPTPDAIVSNSDHLQAQTALAAAYLDLPGKDWCSALRAKNKAIEIKENLDDQLPRIWADERAVRQVALNLLSNAIKFTPQGGEVVIKVGWTNDGGQYLSFRDNGPGIPEEEIPIVMSAFGRGSLAQKNAEEGTGLGLPIVKGLIELHGGEFKLHSKVREGTEVIAIFPPTRVMNALPLLDPNAPTPRVRRATRKAA